MIFDWHSDFGTTDLWPMRLASVARKQGRQKGGRPIIHTLPADIYTFIKWVILQISSLTIHVLQSTITRDARIPANNGQLRE